MIVRIHNSNDTDFIDYEADTIEEIREQAHNRIVLSSWASGWSEVLKK